MLVVLGQLISRHAKAALYRFVYRVFLMCLQNGNGILNNWETVCRFYVPMCTYIHISYGNNFTKQKLRLALKS